VTGVFPRLIAPVVTTTSIILSSSKIQNGDILVPASIQVHLENGCLNRERRDKVLISNLWEANGCSSQKWMKGMTHKEHVAY